MQLKKLLPFSIILILVNYCGTVPDVHYYLIDYLYKPVNVKNAKHQVVLGLEKFTTDPLYESDRIVYRDSPYEAKFYNYHRWITSPTRIVTGKVIEQFSTSGAFKQVVSFPHVSNVDYLVRGTIKAFEEWDEDDEWYAHVKLHFELVKVDHNTLLWQDILMKKTKVVQKNPIELVRSLSISLQACIEEAIEKIDYTLSQY